MMLLFCDPDIFEILVMQNCDSNESAEIVILVRHVFDNVDSCS